MPHCTTNFAWYLGKFIAGFTGMLFFYVVFLKEREYSCLCRARMREFFRRRGENTNFCPLDGQADANASVERGQRSMLAGVENVWTWYTTIREWFLENDPAILSETVLALCKGLPKNDNGNFDFPSKSLGLVSAQKLMRRRRHRQTCVHLRVSQEVISDYWKGCDKKDIDTKKRIIEVIHEPAEETLDERCCNVERKEKRADILQKKVECTVALNVDTDEKDLTKQIKLEFPLVRDNKSCNSYNIPRLSPRKIEYKSKENKKRKDICDDNKCLSPRCINEDTIETLKKENNLCNIDKNDSLKNSSKKTLNRTLSQSDTNLSETIITDSCMDSILYNKLQNKCVPSIKSQSSRDCLKSCKTIEPKLTLKFNLENTEKINSHRELDIDEIMDNFSDKVRTFSLKQAQKYNSKHFMHKHQSASRLQKYPNRNIENGLGVQQKSICTIAWQKNATSQRKLPKFHCQSCCCDAKVRDRNEWNNVKKRSSAQLRPDSSAQPQYKMLSVNVQSQRNDYPYEYVKSSKKSDMMVDCKFSSLHGIRSSKWKSQSLQCKEKPTLVIFKNRKSSGSKNSTNSAYTSSTTSRSTFERSVPDHQATCPCNSHKSQRYAAPLSGQYKYNKYKTRIDPASLMSSSSSLSSSKRCHSWTVLSERSVCHKQEPISSSSCTNVQRWKGKGTSLCLTSSPSSGSLSSSSTFREDYSLEETDRESRQMLKTWRKPKFPDKKKKRIIYMDEHHVRWNIKK
ncbi:hypothetical protein WH47_09757 [Habropoda laboriosa]|uniref:Uncharacterized protein n=1 Tax=Habropoda laboriosa TaxID=597456 RepID=A0A0L7QMK3_9HYME|nr:hypothetical protein WH47_09757 [Habropoda laboriosa]